MKALVTGGGGFLGGAIVRLLRERGDFVRSFSRGSYPQLEALGVEVFRGDLSDPATVTHAVQSCDVVLHVAARPGIWGSFADYYHTNFVGTRNVIDACRKAGIARLVYTSTPSVVFTGSAMEGVDESVPYPESFEADYPKTKALAERLVLQANDASLATVALRPHLIWGPGDNHLLPRILARGRLGQLRRIGNGANRADCVYIDNAAAAHLLAADRLTPGSAIAGKAYFISNGEPLPLWNLIDRLLETGGIAPVSRGMPMRVAWLLGAVLEGVYTVMRWQQEPRMTRFLARELATAHWFDISAARRDLGYHPSVSIDEGMRRLKEWLRAGSP